MQPNPNERTNQFANLTNEALRHLFLEAAAGPRSNGNDFFNNFQYKEDLHRGHWASTLLGGIDLLNQCHSIDQNAFDNIHKGSAYYWIGIASYLLRSYDLTLFFMDATVSEDFRAGHNPVNNPSPGLYFAQLDDEPKEQAARVLVEDARRKMEDSIYVYNHLDRPQGLNDLSIQFLREHFLMKSILPGGEELRSLATALISFRLDWDHRNMLFDIRPAHGTAELFFLHLFKGCVLFESLLRHNSRIPAAKKKGTLDALVKLLHTDLKIGVPNFSGQLPGILSSLQNYDGKIETAIQTTGKLRNALGHDLGWTVNLDKIQYQKLCQIVMSSCLHSIACLY